MQQPADGLVVFDSLFLVLPGHLDEFPHDGRERRTESVILILKEAGVVSVGEILPKELCLGEAALSGLLKNLDTGESPLSHGRVLSLCMPQTGCGAGWA